MAVKAVKRGRERRQEIRVDARLSMRVEGAHDGASAQIVTESQNVSASGVYCLSSHYLPPLSKVQLTIVLPQIPGTSRAKELVKCEGIVVRCELAPGRRAEPRYQLACMFSGIERDLRERLEEFVAWRNLQALRAALAPARRSPRKAAAKKKTAAKSSRSAPVAKKKAAAKRKVARKSATRAAGARRKAR